MAGQNLQFRAFLPVCFSIRDLFHSYRVNLCILFRGPSAPHQRSHSLPLLTSELLALWFQSPLTQAEQWPVHISLPPAQDYFPGISFFSFLISSCLCCICPCATPALHTPLLKSGGSFVCARVCVSHLDPSSVEALISFFTSLCVSRLLQDC